jgi:hypothetical protein
MALVRAGEGKHGRKACAMPNNGNHDVVHVCSHDADYAQVLTMLSSTKCDWLR